MIKRWTLRSLTKNAWIRLMILLVWVLHTLFLVWRYQVVVTRATIPYHQPRWLWPRWWWSSVATNHIPWGIYLPESKSPHYSVWTHFTRNSSGKFMAGGLPVNITMFVEVTAAMLCSLWCMSGITRPSGGKDCHHQQHMIGKRISLKTQD